jgi:hypothetical protein
MEGHRNLEQFDNRVLIDRRNQPTPSLQGCLDGDGELTVLDIDYILH